MIGLQISRRSRGRLLVFFLGVGILLFAARPVPAVAKDGGEVRVRGACGSGATYELRLRGDDDRIEVRFEVDHNRPQVAWRVALVHERRVSWKGSVTTSRSESFELRRTLKNLPGADTVSARAWGPRGLVCQAAATLADS